MSWWSTTTRTCARRWPRRSRSAAPRSPPPARRAQRASDLPGEGSQRGGESGDRRRGVAAGERRELARVVGRHRLAALAVADRPARFDQRGRVADALEATDGEIDQQRRPPGRVEG